jgi:hypothetical protein
MSSYLESRPSARNSAPFMLTITTLCAFVCGASSARPADTLSVAITAPVDGTKVTPGSTITVTATANSTDRGDPISGVIVLSSAVGVSLPAPHFSTSLSLPPGFSGALTLTALARSRAKFGQSNPVTILVMPNDTLTSLTVNPGNYSFIALGGTRSMDVIGTFAGAETADLTDHRLGTTYQSSAINVATVSIDGLVTAVGNGTAKVSVQNGSSHAVAQITVAAPASNSPPQASAGPNKTVHPCHKVALDGTLSYDPNGQLLNYMWTQSAGPPVTLVNPTSPTPSFIAPRKDGVLQFSLSVTDFVGLSAKASTTVTVKACAKGDDDRRCDERSREMVSGVSLERSEWMDCMRSK